MAEFFAMEAGEYLERLDVMVSASKPPDPAEFQRLTRALRGAALMANQQEIAAAAGAFEQVARSLREGERPWDEATRQLATRAVDDLKIFVRKVREWTDAETTRARDLAAALNAASGRPSRPVRAVSGGPDSGTRAFVAREGAALASALDQAAKALAKNPHAAEPLQAVVNVMQPLRGLASLADLPPMPDLLEGIEWAVAETRRGSPAVPTSDVFEAAAHAVSHAARDVASDGHANPEASATKAFADALGRLLQLDQSVEPIDTFFYDDAGPHVVERGGGSERGVEIGNVDLVSHGEHLKQVAEGLDHASTPTLRTFRVYALAETVRALEAGTGSELAHAAAGFARAVKGAIGSGRALAAPVDFGMHLREASAILSAAAQEEAGTLAGRLSLVTDRLAGEPVPERAAPQPAAATPEPVAPAPQPVAHAQPVAIAGKPATGSTGAEPATLAGSLLRYERYVAALGLEPAPLEELLAGPPADPGSAPSAAAVRPAPRETPDAAPTAAPAETLIPITDLCYDGPAALRRALLLRDEMRETLAAGADPAHLIEEIFDLVQLGLERDR